MTRLNLRNIYKLLVVLIYEIMFSRFSISAVRNIGKQITHRLKPMIALKANLSTTN